MGRQLAGSTAGIIGYGPLGRGVAELALAFGMSVLVSDPYVTVEHDRIEQVDLDDLLRRADFVLPLAVATPETENLIDRRALSQMRSDALLVNLSRGNLIDESRAPRSTRAGRIAGAAMDVGRAPDQMPSPPAGQASRRGGDATHRRPDAGGDRGTGTRNRRTGQAPRPRPSTDGIRQCREGIQALAACRARGVKSSPCASPTSRSTCSKPNCRKRLLGRSPARRRAPAAWSS